jgi:hypothetical protein
MKPQSDWVGYAAVAVDSAVGWLVADSNFEPKRATSVFTWLRSFNLRRWLLRDGYWAAVLNAVGLTVFHRCCRGKENAEHGTYAAGRTKTICFRSC